MTNCLHQDQIKETIKPQAEGCVDCLKSGDNWVQVRMCMTCGYTGCCDSSKNRHARKHFEQTQHPIIDGHSPGAKWRWCYVDNDYI